MTDFEPEMKKIFGSGVPDDYLVLRAPEVKIKRSRGITNERQAVLKQFHDKLASNYLSFTKKPLYPKMLAVKVSHLTIKELYEFYGKCDRSTNFSKTFWGSLKISTPLVRHNLKKKI